MRFSQNELKAKALLALEEVNQESRYRPVRRTLVLRFALAYLWAVSRGERDCFDEFWQRIAERGDLHRFGYCDTALSSIYRAVGIEREHELSMRMWKRAEAQFQPRDQHGTFVTPWEPPPP